MNEQNLMDAIAHNYIGNCGKCGNRRLKKHMTAIYTKKGGRDGKMKLLCHVREACVPGVLEALCIGQKEER